MFCTQCGQATADGARFCAHCGAPLQATAQPAQASRTVAPTDPPTVARATSAVAQVRPWVRYWARMFDIYLAAIVGGMAVGIFNPDAFNEQDSEQLFGLVAVFAWVFIESMLLSTTGTTPGKWLFKIRLIPPSGEKPNYSTALSRSFKVWWRGLGIGFPLASLITLIIAHGKLTKNGITTWDKDEGFSVVHERIGPLRVIVAVAFFIGFLLLVVVGNATNV
jgi:uncharacterized RDD family membrane protein YckC